ncbi:MAG: tRNA pseudouridine(55) synthase TruB, partial [Eggerthellaceae bacterium]|nr:tRNA pseudouridine(55) synthase TruB [Eggerthellaceae bacterium]
DTEEVAELRFGEERVTDDAEGEVVCAAPVPKSVGDVAYASEVLSRFVGLAMQVPPAYSAIKQGGVTAYKAARSGGALELPARSVEVYEAALLGTDAASWLVRFRVSKGTYIRSLARDIGRAVGCGAYLGGLRRELLGTVAVGDCVAFDDLANQPLRRLNPLQVLGFPQLEVLEVERKSLENGGSLAIPASLAASVNAGAPVSVLCDNRLKAIYRVEEGASRLKCDCLFSIGVDCG